MIIDLFVSEVKCVLAVMILLNKSSAFKWPAERFKLKDEGGALRLYK